MNWGEEFGLTEVQNFLDRMGVALFVFNVQNNTAYVSNAAQEIYGYSQEDFQKNPMLWSEVIHPEDQHWIHEFTLNWEPGKVRNREYRISRPNDEMRWIQTRSTAAFDNEGKLLHIEGLLHDITDAKYLEEKIWENEKRYRAVVENSPQSIVVVQNERIVYSNWATAKVLGLKSREEILEQPIYDLVCDEDILLVRERMNRPFDPHDIQSSEVRFKMSEGQYIVAQLISVPMLYMGKPAYLIMGNDISDRKQIEEALIEAESKYRNLVEGALVGVYLYQEDRLIYVNPYIQKVFGYSLEELNSKNLTEFMVEKDRSVLLENLELLRTGVNEITREYQAIKKNGEIADIQIQAAVTIFKGAPAIIGTVQDITYQIKAHKEVREMAFSDALTGLLNRYALNMSLEESIKTAKENKTQIGILFMDLDRFKFINDSLGHEAGDLVLNEIALRLKQCVRKEDIVSRYGGDEFILVLQDTNPEGIERVAERIMNALNRPYLYGNEELFATPSIGISIYPLDGESAQTLIKNADAAMYLAKENGKNNYQFFSSQISDKQSRRLKLEKGLRKAIQKGEFTLHYQPQVNFQSGEVIGFEALLRWDHPEFGRVPPSEFIPIAEEIGQINAIGNWVLETACQKNKDWQNQGYPPVPMAVNISGQEFLQEHFVERVEEILKRTQLDPHYLELEITESTMKNIKVLTPLLTKLQAMGVRTSIDDFGTGYSSLSLIKNLPIDVIKIDRSFIVDMLSNTTSSLMVKAIIEMGASLNSLIIAEGIETKEEVEFLKQTKCQVGQGYLFARPLPAEEIEKYILHRKDH